MSEKLTVFEAWSAVMGAVQGIKKGDRNKQQGFNFRGIDAVMNAVGPELRKHRVTVLPYAEEIITSTYQSSGGTTMHSAIVKVRYEVFGPAGDSFDGCTYGEAADAGDKAVSKAQSVAYRTFLLQGLTIPTDEPDPDAESHERTGSPDFRQKLLNAAKGLVDAGKKDDMLAAFSAKGLPTKSSDMSDDEVKLALQVLEEQFAA